MLHSSLTWEGRFLDSRFRGNDELCKGLLGKGPGVRSNPYAIERARRLTTPGSSVATMLLALGTL